MNETTANEFRKTLKSKVDRTIANHTVLKVKRRNGENFVVIGEKDWKAIEETLYLNQFSGLVDSIHQADREPLEQGTPLEELEW
ncbi:MAG: type II toxin-antitoxin system Phd/YefM family antitoxin [Deltaproteobacteria bacterium]|nr:type II toxin-antitoxin system Phd/YefM family antitoxin [Deltaproteobacteria bacterium]MBW1818821.1 type II toxin-antitoxin system Phd/YefM family antitoxin [Deltaproteobacteria bacterium]